MSEIKSIVVMNPNQTPQAPIMKPIPKPTLVNTQFTPVSKPTTQQAPPFETISMITPQIKIKEVEMIAPMETSPKSPSMTDYLPLISLGVIGLLILNR
jgi:hypothetical protein